MKTITKKDLTTLALELENALSLIPVNHFYSVISTNDVDYDEPETRAMIFLDQEKSKPLSSGVEADKDLLIQKTRWFFEDRKINFEEEYDSEGDYERKTFILPYKLI